MSRVTCRCGEVISIASSEGERVTCPRCGAKIRIRRPAAARNGSRGPDDGYIRFPCPCGRRLKVQKQDRPEAGKCPDCGRVVPVPASAWEQVAGSAGIENPNWAGRSDPEARTADLEPGDLERLAQWSSTHQKKANGARSPGGSSSPASNQRPHNLPTIESTGGRIPSGVKMEAGFRVCPRCQTPLHMSATVCRSCGEPAPKR